MQRRYGRGGAVNRLGVLAIALAITIPLFASGALASTTPAASRAVLAATPSPSPPDAQRTVGGKEIVTDRMATLSRSQPRRFTVPRAVANAPASPSMYVSRYARSAITRSLDYCAQHPPEIDSVSGDVTPGAVLTIGGSCFGTSGTARISGVFPYEPGGVNLLIESWSEGVVKARLFHNAYGGFGSAEADSFTGAPDQQIQLSVATHRVAGGMTVVGPGVVSAPVALHYTARRVTISANVDTVACAGGDPLDAQHPDFCAQSGWGAYSCDAGKCMESYHARKDPATGEDVYSLRLGHGYVLNAVMVYGDGADLVFDPTLDPSHVTFRIRWRTLRASNPDLVKRGYPQYADYNDGSYMFLPFVTGPDGIRP